MLLPFFLWNFFLAVLFIQVLKRSVWYLISLHTVLSNDRFTTK